MQKWTRVMYQPNVPLGENGEKVNSVQKTYCTFKGSCQRRYGTFKK